MSVGFRVFTQRRMPKKEVMDGFRLLPAANVADVMGRSCAMSSEIHTMLPHTDAIMVGPALTVRARPGDNLMIHKALNMAQEGDILVIANEGDRSQSLLGAIIVAYARSKKLGGIVVDGNIRDVDEIAAMGLPVYATGSTPGGPYKEGPGEVNTPISCGGVAVCPGDIILADSDGVIVIPRKDSEKILVEAQIFAKADKAKMQAALDGSAKREWVDKKLTEKQCEIIDGCYEDLG